MSSAPVPGTVHNGLYWCNCSGRCNGGKWVVKKTFNKHAPKRPQNANSRTYDNFLASSSANMLGPPPAGAQDPPLASTSRLPINNQDLPRSPSLPLNPSPGERGTSPPLAKRPRLSVSPHPRRSAGPASMQPFNEMEGSNAEQQDDGGDPEQADPSSLDDLERTEHSPPPERQQTPDPPPPERGNTPPPPPDREDTPPPPPENRNPSPPPNNPPPVDDRPLWEPLSAIDGIAISQRTLQCLDGASLDKSGIDPKIIERIRNPPKTAVDISDDKDLLLSLRLFVADENASVATYNNSRNAFLDHSPHVKLLSHHSSKKVIEEITGVSPVRHHMCPKSCIGYTGPYADLETCPRCGEPRYNPVEFARNGNKVPQLEFETNLIGPVLQAIWRSKDGARQMKYRREHTEKIINAPRVGPQNDQIKIDKYDDIFVGQAYLDAVESGEIKPEDTVLVFSTDGAQLYTMKQSDCWVYIWILFDLDPQLRYKKKYIIPGGTVPGKPGDFESFIFPGLYHLAALMREGLTLWDAETNTSFLSFIFLILVTADAIGMAMVDGAVGPTGAYGCRLLCPFKGRHKPGKSTYYSASLKPDNYTVAGCDHDDVPLVHLQGGTPDEYIRCLRLVMSARTDARYAQYRLETGIVRPTIFSAIPRILPVPTCFPGDIMHEILNLFELFLGLWRATLDCDDDDDRSTWAFAALANANVFKAHGKRVVDATPYLPGSYDHPPRNIAEKITSGYKAEECMTYLFGLAPGLLYGLLGAPYWRNWCKIVRGFRIAYQREITVAQAIEAHTCICDGVREFEELYYQRRTSRLHFVRQSIHNLPHLLPELLRLGPPALYAQWATERTIGNLGEEVKQHSTPFANLAARARLRAQLNTLKILVPKVEQEKPLPSRAVDLKNGYVLLHARDDTAYPVHDAAGDAIADWLALESGIEAPEDFRPHLMRYARLRLPNGQIARSAWKEKLKPLKKVRMARNIHFEDPDVGDMYAEVQFYFQAHDRDGKLVGVALVAPYSAPDMNLLQESSKALWVCEPTGETHLRVIRVEQIKSVVAIVPFDEERFFVFHQMGVDMGELRGYEEEDTE